MRLARVRGNVVSSAKVASLSGFKLLFVQDIDPLEPSETDTAKGAGDVYVAIDLAGAGDNEIVLVTTGSAARVESAGQYAPTDAAVVGIVDIVNYNGRVTYVKR